MKNLQLTPIDEALIERVARRLVAACQPVALYLFGSAARGEAAPGSDLDLLVVTDLPEGVSQHEQAAELWTLFQGWSVPFDIIVQTPEQFARQQTLPGFIARTARREGRLLHKKASFAEAPMPDPDPQEGARAWLKKATSNLRGARAVLALAPPETDLAAFHSQQAAEKCLKAFLAYQREEPPRTHDLEELLDVAASYDERFEALREAAAFLRLFAVRVRYPGEEPISEAQAVRSVEHAEATCQTVRTKLNLAP